MTTVDSRIDAALHRVWANDFEPTKIVLSDADRYALYLLDPGKISHVAVKSEGMFFRDVIIDHGKVSGVHCIGRSEPEPIAPDLD